MSKLSAKKPGKVHPLSPHDRLALLPAAILALTAVLSPEDTEVLAYLISFSGSFSAPPKTTQGNDDSVHPPRFDCDCFRCYTSFWSRWDASPNREVIHEIIEAYEEGLFRKKSSKNASKVKKRKKNNNKVCDEEQCGDDAAARLADDRSGAAEGDGSVGGVDASSGREAGPEKGSVRKIVSFIGERIWGVWNKV